jgi:hypothetical protein
MSGFIVTSTRDHLRRIFVGPFQTEAKRSAAVADFWEALNALNRELGLQDDDAIGATIALEGFMVTQSFVTAQQAVELISQQEEKQYGIWCWNMKHLHWLNKDEMVKVFGHDRVDKLHQAECKPAFYMPSCIDCDEDELAKSELADFGFSTPAHRE